MATTGQYVVFEGVGRAVLRPFEVARPGPGEVLVENEFTVISAGTERANLLAMPNTGTGPGGYDGRSPGGFPFYPGYCGVGRIVELGEGVESAALGERVVVNWAGHRSHSIKAAKGLVRVEEGLDSLEAAFAPIVAFSFLGVRKLRLELGESALILGQGLLGVFALQAAVLSGAIPVLVSDFNEARRELGLKLGAAAAFAPDARLVENVMAATGSKGVDAVVEVTGSAKALQHALECVAWEGRVSLLGCTRVSDVPIDFYRYVHTRGITLVGAHTATRPSHESAPGRWTEADDYRTYLKLLAAGKMQARAVVSEIVSPEHAAEVYGRLAEDPDFPLGIVFDWRIIR